MNPPPSHVRSAFTLVELLVVIGLIAVLIGLLLPVLSTVQARGRDLKCQANLRSIIQAMHGYAAENNGAMPWGFVWNRSNRSPPGAPAADNDGRYITWATLVGKHLSKHSDGIADESQANFQTLFPKVLQCPEAEQARPHVVSYAANWLVCVFPWKEYNHTPGVPEYMALTRTTRLTHLLRETAVVWDTGIAPEWLIDPRWRLGADIDRQRVSLAGVHVPQYRYWTVRDIFAQYPPGIFGQNKPILLDWPQYVYYNREPDSIRLPYQGNLRFRHQKDTTCNVGFSDGSVRQVTAKMNPDKTVKSHDAIRRYFMIKWPTGVRPHPRYPS